MKKLILILISTIWICYDVSAQSAGDYRSVADGNWNDASKWETYDGTAWIAASSYPGQNSGTRQVFITLDTRMIITASVPNAIASLDISGDYNCSGCDPEQSPALFGRLSFSAAQAVSLLVSGSVAIFGELRIDDQAGAKSHSLVIGGSLGVGDSWWDYEYYETPTVFETINQDDKLSVLFNTTVQWSAIWGTRPISFQDVSFNGIGISISNIVDIYGTANFINGVVNADYYGLTFQDGAIAFGASNASFVNGPVAKRGDDPFVFPTGYLSSAPTYSPLTISAPVGATEIFTARYYMLASGQFNTIRDPGLYNVSNCEFWTLYRTSGYGNYGLDVTIGWSATGGCSASTVIDNVANVTLAKKDATEVWASHSGSGVGTTTNGSVTWYGADSQGGTFSLGNLNTNCLPPAVMSANNITPTTAQLSWGAVGGALSYDIDYKLTTGCCWINLATATTSTTTNISGLDPLLSYDWRVRTRCGSSTSDYRMAQFTTIAGSCNMPAGLTATNITSTSATLNWNAVSGATNYTVQYRASFATNTWTTIVAGTTALSCNLSGLFPNNAYTWRVSADCSGYAQSSFTAASAPPSCMDYYEPNNVSGQAITLGLSVYDAGISSASDIDWYKVTTPNNSSTNLKVTLSNLAADCDLYVYDKNLILVGSSVSAGTGNELVIYNSKFRKATYYIRVVGKNGAYNLSQCYHLLMEVFSSAKGAHHVSVPLDEITKLPGNQVIYPNPASAFILVGFTSTLEGPVNMEIMNIDGQLIKQTVVQLIKGANQVRIAVSDIPPGTYILKLNKGELNMIRKFVIAR